MKEWWYEFKLDVWHWWDYRFGHRHKFSMAGMCVYEGEPRENPHGIPLVAWVYRCKCEHEIVELCTAGIELLQKGVDYDALIECRI